MRVTACICTTNRTKDLVRAISSIAASDYRDFDVLVVDQSHSDESYFAVRDLRVTLPEFPRLTYIRSTTTGSSAAHNIAAQHASGDIIAFTDDDCEVASHWLGTLVSYFDAHPNVAQICGAVNAGPHDTTRGFIPTFYLRREQLVATPWLKWREGGIGANMAFRLDALRAVGPFDEMLGTGAPLHSCLDGDITYRMLRAGYTVACIPEVAVTHHGFRTWEEGRTLMQRCGIGVAAAYTKHLRLGDVAVLPTLLCEWMRCISWRRLFLLRRYTGLRRFLAFTAGILLSFRYSIDRDSRMYRHAVANEANEDLGILSPEVQVHVFKASRQTPQMATADSQ